MKATPHLSDWLRDVLAVVESAAEPQTCNGVALALSEQLPQRERDAGKTVSDHPVRRALTFLHGQGLVKAECYRVPGCFQRGLLYSSASKGRKARG